MQRYYIHSKDNQRNRLEKCKRLYIKKNIVYYTPIFFFQILKTTNSHFRNLVLQSHNYHAWGLFQ
jgi:hypothetical protein